MQCKFLGYVHAVILFYVLSFILVIFNKQCRHFESLTMITTAVKKGDLLCHVYTQRLVIWSVVQLLFKLVICCSWMRVDCLQVNTATELKTGLKTKSYTRDLCVSMDLSPFIWRPACHWLSVSLCHNAVGNIAVLPFSNPSHGWWRWTDFSRKSVQERATTLTITNNVNAAVPPHVSSVVFSISLQTIPTNKGFIYCKHVKNCLYM